MIDNLIILLKVPFQFISTLIIVSFLSNIIESKDLDRERVWNPFFFLLISLYRLERGYNRSVGNDYELFVLGFISLVYLLLCKKGKIIEKIFWASFFVVIYMESLTLAFVTLSYLNEISLREVLKENSFFLLGKGIGIFIKGALFYFVYRNKKKLKFISEPIALFFLILTSVNIGVIWNLLKEFFYTGNLITKEVLFLVYLILILILSCVYILKIFSKQTEIFLNKEIQEIENKQMKTHTKEMFKVFEKLKGWRHDWKNHLIVIEYLANNNEIERMKEYITKIKEESNESFESLDMVKTEKPVLDALLNSKLMLAKNSNTEVKVNVTLKKEIPVEDVDLCTLVGNLLDNSIEANSKGGWINFSMEIGRGNLIITMENSIGLAIPKKDREFHGVGLIQIDEIVKKYHGTLKRKAQEEVYYTKIIIPLHFRN